MRNHPPPLHTDLPAWLARFVEATAGEVVETHISWVVLADEVAYKFKKPVTLPFLDYGSAARRRFFCDEELRLNRRFAPGLYLDVISVPGEAGAEEWAVRMRRFAEGDRLDHRCARGDLCPQHLSDLARVVADFHEQATVAAAATPFGEPAEVLSCALENFDELNRLLPSERRRLDALHAWTHDEFTRIRSSLQARKRDGHIRECHGDLHLGNLVLMDGQVTPFDCIEFNENFRWIDVASELAFTYVDLLDHRRPDLAGWLLNEWLARTGDFDAVPLLRFYSAYRALVRAKVAGIRGDPAEAADYLTMAERLTRPAPPRLVIANGLASSGKTTASAAMLLADAAAGTLRVRSDLERKRIHGLPLDIASRSGLAAGIYDVESSARTYARLAEIADRCLGAGWSVIVDAAFLEREQRQVFHRLAERHAASFSILACSAPLEELQRRIAARHDDASEATLTVLDWQRTRAEPLTADEQRFVIENHVTPTR